MEIVKWDKYSADSGQMVRVTIAEALELIESLSRQVRTGDPNGGRAEFITVDGEYFSISVQPNQPNPLSDSGVRGMICSSK